MEFQIHLDYLSKTLYEDELLTNPIESISLMV